MSVDLTGVRARAADAHHPAMVAITYRNGSVHASLAGGPSQGDCLSRGTLPPGPIRRFAVGETQTAAETLTPVSGRS